MHDRNGNPLKVGDTVSITGKITHLNPSENYCNVDVETVHGRRPDGHKERITAINTGVMDLVTSEEIADYPSTDELAAAAGEARYEPPIAPREP